MREQAAWLLVVDDQEPNRDLLKRRLERKGYCIETARNGAEALDCIAKGRFDLVLLDIEMPGMTGLEVLTKIRETRSGLQLPVIMVTGRAGSEDIAKALNLGANDYITKPIDLLVAAARIRTHLINDVIVPGHQHGARKIGMSGFRFDNGFYRFRPDGPSQARPDKHKKQGSDIQAFLDWIHDLSSTADPGVTD